MSDLKDSIRSKRKYLASMILVLIPYILYILWLVCKVLDMIVGRSTQNGGLHALLTMLLVVMPFACPILSAISSVAGLLRIKDLRAEGMSIKRILMLGLVGIGMAAATVVVMILRVKAAVGQ